jgi:hypothetical protein
LSLLALKAKPATRHLASPHLRGHPFWGQLFDIGDRPPVEGCGDLAGLGSPRQRARHPRAPGEHEQHRVAGAEICYGSGDGVALGVVKTMEAAAVDEEPEAVADARTRQVGDVAEDEPHRAGGRPSSCRLNCTRHVVDANRVPAATRQLNGLQSRATAQVERPTVRRGTGLLFPVEESGQVPVDPATLPRLEAQEVQQLVGDGHAATI